MRARLLARKPVSELTHEAEDSSLRRALGRWDVTALGVGAIIGAGIFASTGSAIAGGASHLGAGPAIVISFLPTGVACGSVATPVERAALGPRLRGPAEGGLDAGGTAVRLHHLLRESERESEDAK